MSKKKYYAVVGADDGICRNFNQPNLNHNYYHLIIEDAGSYLFVTKNKFAAANADPISTSEAEMHIKLCCSHIGIEYVSPNELAIRDAQDKNNICSCGKECKPSDNGECYDCWNRKHCAKFM